FDLYRLVDGEELEYMGIRDFFRPDSLCLVEWPERGGDYLPPPDLDIQLSVEGRGRGVVIMALSHQGQRALVELHADCRRGEDSVAGRSSQGVSLPGRLGVPEPGRG